MLIESTYLILTFPRAAVALITLLPNLVVKVLLPYFMSSFPTRARPIIVSACFLATTLLAIASPPNVPPPMRLLVCILAEVTSAATEVALLGSIQEFGRSSLQGWSVGSGVGYLVCAIWPFVWTFKMGYTLLEGTPYGIHLAIALFGAFYLIPGAKSDTTGSKDGLLQPDTRAAEAESTKKELVCLFESGTNISPNLLKPYMVILYAVAVMQSFIVPGISRATPRGSSEDFEASATTTNASLALGILLGRSSFLSYPVGDLRPLVTVEASISVAIMLNDVFIFYGGDVLSHLWALLLGILSGIIYINVYGHALESLSRDAPTQARFGLSFIGCSEVLGLLVGNLTGCVIESRLCAEPESAIGRWCSPR